MVLAEDKGALASDARPFALCLSSVGSMVLCANTEHCGAAQNSAKSQRNSPTVAGHYTGRGLGMVGCCSSSTDRV